MKSKIIVSCFVMLGIALAFAVPAMGAASNRPIEDWLLNNPYGFNLYGGKYAICMGVNAPTIPIPSTGSILGGGLAFPMERTVLADIFTVGDAQESLKTMWKKYGKSSLPSYYPKAWGSMMSEHKDYIVIADDSSIIEKVLPDGRAGITANIHVKNGPLTIYRIDEWLAFRRGAASEPTPILGDGANGTIEYTLQAKFVNPKPGMEIAFILDYANDRVPGGKMESLSYNGTGYGTFTAHAADFSDLNYTPGGTGTLHLPGHHPVGKLSNSDGIEDDYLTLE